MKYPQERIFELRNNHKKNFGNYKIHKEKVQTHEKSTHKKFRTHKLPSRKNFGTRKYPQEKSSNP